MCILFTVLTHGLPSQYNSNGNTTPPSATSDTIQQVNLQTRSDVWGTLAGALTTLNLPADRPRPSHRSTNGSKIPILIDATLTRSLKKLALEQNMDLSMIVMAGWGAVLARLSSQDDIIIGLHHSGPCGPRSNQLAYSNNTLPLRLELPGELSISQLLKRVRKSVSFSMDHRGFPLDDDAEIASSPLFQVALRWNIPLRSSTTIQVDLELQLQEQDNEVLGDMLFSTDLFNLDTVKRHVGYLCSMLQAIAAGVDQLMSSVDLLPQSEHDLVLGKWNKTQQDYPDQLCIHHLFEQQVERTPHATALVLNGQSLTYTELNDRANRLAHRLIELGVRPDSLVAICVERSFSMITGVLAILKAGGAYVPLDPVYASNRLKDILADASPSIVVTDATGRATLGEAAMSMVVVDTSAIQEADQLQER